MARRQAKRFHSFTFTSSCATKETFLTRVVASVSSFRTKPSTGLNQLRKKGSVKSCGREWRQRIVDLVGSVLAGNSGAQTVPNYQITGGLDFISEPWQSDEVE